MERKTKTEVGELCGESGKGEENESEGWGMGMGGGDGGETRSLTKKKGKHNSTTGIGASLTADVRDKGESISGVRDTCRCYMLPQRRR